MEEIYQEVANGLVDFIPEEWEKIYVYAEIREAYESMFFYYYPSKGGNPIYSLDIPELFEINDSEFIEREEKLYGYFSDLLEEFKKQGQDHWSYLTFILDNSGKMKIDYEYEDVSQKSPVDKRAEWEAKYLQIES